MALTSGNPLLDLFDLAAAADPTSTGDLPLWNPDGRQGGPSDCYAVVRWSCRNVGDDSNNAIR